VIIHVGRIFDLPVPANLVVLIRGVVGVMSIGPVPLGALVLSISSPAWRKGIPWLVRIIPIPKLRIRFS
jgi:hypothetical protein